MQSVVNTVLVKSQATSGFKQNGINLDNVDLLKVYVESFL